MLADDVGGDVGEDGGRARCPPDFLFHSADALVVGALSLQKKINLGFDAAHCALEFVAHFAYRLMMLAMPEKNMPDTMIIAISLVPPSR